MPPEAALLTPPTWLAAEAADRLLERLEWLRLTPQRIVWLGEAAAVAARALTKRYPAATLACYHPNDRSALPNDPLLARLCARLTGTRRVTASIAPPDQLPEAPAGVSLLMANLLLHHTATPETLLTAWQQWLAPQAPLFFVTFGPDTLKELRPLFPVPPWPVFPDMHDVGDLLMRLRYAEPVMDMHYLTITYQTPEGLLADWGSWLGDPAREAAARLAPSPTGATSVLAPLGFPCTLTVELVFGHAWQPATLSAERATPRTTSPQPIVWHRKPPR